MSDLDKLSLVQVAELLLYYARRGDENGVVAAFATNIIRRLDPELLKISGAEESASAALAGLVPRPAEVGAHIIRLEAELDRAWKLYDLAVIEHGQSLPSIEQRQQQHEGAPRA